MIQILSYLGMKDAEDRKKHDGSLIAYKGRTLVVMDGGVIQIHLNMLHNDRARPYEILVI